MGTFCSNKEFYPHVCNITKNLKGHILNRNMVPEAILTLSCKSQWNIPWALRVMLFYFGAISCYTTGKNSQYSSYGFKSRQALRSHVTGDSRYSTPLPQLLLHISSYYQLCIFTQNGQRLVTDAVQQECDCFTSTPAAFLISVRGKKKSKIMHTIITS